MHMAVFMTLCGVYMGIEPHFNLWNYFFHVRLQQGLGAEGAVLDDVDIFVRSGLRVHPYFYLPKFGPPDGWWKVWFFLRNNTNAPLSVFMGSRPTPNPTRGMVWSGQTFTGYNPYTRSFNGYSMNG
jgi:hypothetical protein